MIPFLFITCNICSKMKAILMTFKICFLEDHLSMLKRFHFQVSLLDMFCGEGTRSAHPERSRTA